MRFWAIFFTGIIVYIVREMPSVMIKYKGATTKMWRTKKPHEPTIIM